MTVDITKQNRSKKMIAIQWIDATKRVPENSLKKVGCVVRDGIVLYPSIVYYVDAHWHSYTMGIPLHITHWCNLPEADDIEKTELPK